MLNFIALSNFPFVFSSLFQSKKTSEFLFVILTDKFLMERILWSNLKFNLSWSFGFDLGVEFSSFVSIATLNAETRNSLWNFLLLWSNSELGKQKNWDTIKQSCKKKKKKLLKSMYLIITNRNPFILPTILFQSIHLPVPLLLLWTYTPCMPVTSVSLKVAFDSSVTFNFFLFVQQEFLF